MTENQLRKIINEEIRNILNEDMGLGLIVNGKSVPISSIARIILADWRPVSPYAKPYLMAMRGLYDMSDDYGADSANSVVSYFLSNASTWRGPVAKEVKLHLNKMLKGKIKVE